MNKNRSLTGLFHRAYRPRWNYSATMPSDQSDMPYEQAKPKRASARSSRYRPGFTLLELLLSLSLIVVATSLIGFILASYSRDFTKTADDIRNKQLARALLNMIAEDIRAVVLEQKYDGSVLEQQLGATTGGGEQAPVEPATGLASDTAAPATDAGTGGVDDPGSADALTAAYPPGIYGDQFSLMVEVSRLPRPDEYLVQQTSLIDGTLSDVPGDIKTVQYFVQAETSMGVSDDMSVFGAAPGDLQAASGFASGLVRRALDRGVTAYAEEIGDTQRLQRTGDLVAPEVISVEFAYYDGVEAQWVYEWDSSQSSLPWLIQITLAMQSESGAEQGVVAPGTQISTISLDDQRAYGIEIYELVVAIPGANLLATDSASADQAAGMSAVGL